MFKRVFLSLIVGFLILVNAPASAADLPVTIVDLQYIMRESKAAKSVQEQISDLRDNYKKELQKKEASLKEKEQELIEQRKVLSNEEFDKARKEFEKNVIAVQKEVREKQVKLDKAFSTAMDKIRAEAVKIIAAQAEKKGASLVLPRQNIIIVDQSLDITKEVVSLLDSSLSDVDVEL